MNSADIQSFRMVGRRLRNARERRGLTLAAFSASCGLRIQELVRIESGELLGFKQASEDTLSHADMYARVLNIELQGMGVQHSGIEKINSKDDDLYIPAFLRKK